jgi:DNA-binding MarR family transcriptional regulator
MIPEDVRRTDLPEELAPAAAALKRLSSALGTEMFEVFSHLNLTLPQFRVLHAIRKEGRVSGRRLARELNVSPGAVVQLCDRLQEQGYVDRVPDLEDRRVTWFELTPSAQALFEELLALRRSRLAQALGRLPEQDRETLTRILGELAELLEADRSTSGEQQAAAACGGESVRR